MRVGGAVVEQDLVTLGVDHPAAREHDLVDVALALVPLVRPEGPFVARRLSTVVGSSRSSSAKPTR